MQNLNPTNKESMNLISFNMLVHAKTMNNKRSSGSTLWRPVCGDVLFTERKNFLNSINRKREREIIKQLSIKYIHNMKNKLQG